jgi:hypothetical protein
MIDLMLETPQWKMKVWKVTLEVSGSRRGEGGKRVEFFTLLIIFRNKQINGK